MITGELKNKVDSIWDTIWTGGITSPITVLEQITYLIFMKLLDDNQLKAGLKPFPEGTVILSSRAPIGKTAIAGCEMYCNQGFKNLICSDEINNKYLYFFLSSKTVYLNSLGRGATFKELSKKIVENIELS